MAESAGWVGWDPTGWDAPAQGWVELLDELSGLEEWAQ